MKEMIFSDITLDNNSRSYINSLFSLLSHCNLFDLPKFMLSGMTGMCFKFTCHERILPSSLDMYDWCKENWLAVNNLGIYNETFGGNPLDSTFPLYQEAAIEKIKTSIDNGRAVISWGLNKSCFSLITGYSDYDNVFFYKQSDNETMVLLYDNFGIVPEGDWFIQIIGDKINLDFKDIYKNSLALAVKEWDSPYKVNKSYGSGMMAYNNMISALERNDFHLGGLFYLYKNYMKLKNECYLYLKEVSKEFPNILPILNHYKVVVDIYNNIYSLYGMEDITEIKVVPLKLITLLKEVFATEEKAIDSIKNYLSETLENRKINPTRVKII